MKEKMRTMCEWLNERILRKKMQAINSVFGQEALAKITGTQIIKYVIVNSVLFQNKASLLPRHDLLLAKAPQVSPDCTLINEIAL